VFVSGSWKETGVSGGAIALASGYAVLHARRWRWSFCRKLCPIGLYYSAVQSSALVGIGFDSSACCTDCGGCAGVCPVHLDPRALDAIVPSPGGLGFSGLTANTHCLRCGACVEVCEHMMRKQPGPAAMGFRSPRRRAGRSIGREC
jgi:ferredoxin-type protein NapH